jgi:hypothetical protein
MVAIFLLRLHRTGRRDSRAHTADRHRRRQQRTQLVVEAEATAEPPRETEHDGDQQQRLNDRRARGGDEHLQVDRRAEQDQARLDEELGAETAGERVTQHERGQYEVSEQAQSDCVDRELDRLGHLGEGRPRRPLWHLSAPSWDHAAGDRADEHQC